MTDDTNGVHEENGHARPGRKPKGMLPPHSEKPLPYVTIHELRTLGACIIGAGIMANTDLRADVDKTARHAVRVMERIFDETQGVER